MNIMEEMWVNIRIYIIDNYMIPQVRWWISKTAVGHL